MKELNTAIFEDFPVIRTGRLLLRELRKSDAQQVLRMRANTHVNRFIARDQMAHLEDAGELIQSVVQRYRDKEAIAWAGILRDQGAIIGTCGFNKIEADNRHAEIGGELDPQYWGKGIALEAVEAIVNFGLDHMNLHTIEAKVTPANRGAIHLLEQLGFEQEGYFRQRMRYRRQFWALAVYTKFARD
jgi:ribosomal-protein-alanine N-acetyltransferase